MPKLCATLVTTLVVAHVLQAGTSAQPARQSPATYCGVHALARALALRDHPVPFVDLLRPEFISCRKGSSAADLVRAANYFGVEAQVTTRLNCLVLQQLNIPAILHVKKGLTDYNHWVLYAG